VIKGIAIFFLSIYLLGTTPIGQLCRLPMLLSHFQEHQKENKDLSFIGFLKMHYFNGDPKDADYDKDMKLPFKTIDVNTSISVYTAFEMPSFQIERQNFIDLKVNKFSTSDSWYSNSYLDAIWQPPRVA
jgi:hypothetical protein